MRGACLAAILVDPGDEVRPQAARLAAPELPHIGPRELRAPLG